MPDTRGFEVLLEADQSVLLKVLQGAWKSAECPDAPGDEGRIPEFRDIPAGTSIGGFVVADGQVQIPRAGLGAAMAPDVDGVDIKLGLLVQVEIQDPPVPSLSLLDLAVDLHAKVPVAARPSKHVGMVLDGLPRGNVTATLTSGDPLATKLLTLVAEVLHRAYENGSPGATVDPRFPTIAHEQDAVDVTWSLGGVGGITLDSHTELYDDLDDPSRRIVVTSPTAGSMQISIPMYLRMHNIRRTGLARSLTLLDPMAVETRMVVTTALESPPGSYRLRLDTAVVTTGPISPAAGVEGSNYTANRSAIPIVSLDALISNEIASRGTTLIRAMGATSMAVPTVGQIEQAIGDLFHADLEARDFVAIWTPDTSAATFSVRDVATRALSDTLVIALNAAPTADIDGIARLIPASREFAIALDGGAVQQMLDQSRADNGFADSDLPKRMRQDGKDVDLTSLQVRIVDGAIRMTGEVTVIDAVLGCIDVDADFRAEIGLHWQPNAALNGDGVQRMEHHIIGEPEVDPEQSVALWIIGIILAVISFGAGSILIAIVIILVTLLVTSIASNIGGAALVDGVTGAVSGITGWPPELSRIGTVTAIFHDPIVIEASGIAMAGMLEVVSSCASTQVVPADSGSAYSAVAAAPITLTAQRTASVASYAWLPGDGAAAVTTRDILHRYDASGLYIAKHTLTVNESGGATSRHFAAVAVANLAPMVDAGADITVDEGEVVTLIGSFEDVEYADTHESRWNFGDSSPVEAGVLTETNVPPKAVGTTRVHHAWCDNGQYEVSLLVRDHNGGLAVDARSVTVRNVPPTVDAGPEMFAYPCSVLTLDGAFRDPGWCDTHQACWDFGDCSPERRAIVRETNEPPEAHGEASASHVFERCGTYLATCTVVDDDGGVGQDTTVIRVVDVVNKDFEGGFRSRHEGRIANGWDARDGTVGFPDEFIVHGGQRAQGFRPPAGKPSCILQRVGANPGWEYEVTAWYSVSEGDGRARLGMDPTGASDPGGAAVVWDTGADSGAWSTLAVRATARASAITIFLEATAGGSDERAAGEMHFDDVALLAMQPNCPTPPTEPPEPDAELCVIFAARSDDDQLPNEFEADGFIFRMLDSGPCRIVRSPRPLQAAGLELRRGALVDLPVAADRVEVAVAGSAPGAATVLAVDASGAIVDRTDVRFDGLDVERLEVSASGIVRLQVTVQRTEAILFQACISPHRGGPMSESDSEPRRVLERHRAEIFQRFEARGVGIGRADDESKTPVISVYVDSRSAVPDEPVSIEGVPLRFMVTGPITPQ